MGDEADNATPAPAQTWPMVVKLNNPVSFGNDTITELVFQRGKLGLLKGMSLERTPTADEAMLIASRLCGQPLKVIESLEDEDAGAAVGAALGFFSRCLGVGKTS